MAHSVSTRRVTKREVLSDQRGNVLAIPQGGRGEQHQRAAAEIVRTIVLTMRTCYDTATKQVDPGPTEQAAGLRPERRRGIFRYEIVGRCEEDELMRAEGHVAEARVDFGRHGAEDARANHGEPAPLAEGTDQRREGDGVERENGRHSGGVRIDDLPGEGPYDLAQQQQWDRVVESGI